MNHAVTVKKFPESRAQIEGEIPAETFELYWKEALARWVERAELPGFRKGRAPESLVLDVIGEPKILDDAAHAALNAAYGDAVREHNLQVVGDPEARFISTERGKSFRFSVTVSLIPQINLPPYRAIAENVYRTDGEVSVEEDEVDRALQTLQSMRTATVRESKEQPKTDSEPGTAENGPPLPLDDAFAWSVGPFKNLAELKDALRENMREEKGRKERSKRRGELMERMVETVKETMPAVLVEAELSRLVGQLAHDVTRAGISFADYLAQVKKTEEDLRKEWRGDAEKRVKMQLILDAIARAEQISVTREEILPEVKHLRSHAKNADSEQIERYVTRMARNEKVFILLENAPRVPENGPA